jgi:hypothetical protein
MSPGPNVIKLFTAVIMNVRVFVHGRPFQPSLMFESKAGAYLRCSTLGHAPDLPLKQLDQTRKACQGQTL